MSMKKLIIALLMMAAMPACAQRIDKPGEPYDYYLQVMPLGELNSVKISSVKLCFEDTKAKLLVDENNEKMKFSNIAEVLLYFSKRGWTLDREFDFNKHHVFLMKKSVTDDSQAREHLRVEN